MKRKASSVRWVAVFGALPLLGVAVLACDSAVEEEPTASELSSELNQSSCSCNSEGAVAPYQGTVLCVLRGAGPTFPVLRSMPRSTVRLADGGVNNSPNAGCGPGDCAALLKKAQKKDDDACLSLGPPTIPRGFIPPYDIRENNCHHAANAAARCNAQTTSVLACNTNVAPTGPNVGHTVSIDRFPCNANAGADCRTYCVWEPQRPTSAEGCCWNQAGDTPDLKGMGSMCVREKCKDQWSGNPGVLDAGAPVGVKWCAENNTKRGACKSCCTRNAWPNSGPVANYDRWNTACLEACDDL